MKTLFSIACLLLAAAVSTTQVGILDEAKGDAGFLADGFAQDCYFIKIGELTSKAEKPAVAEVQAALANEVTAQAESGCAAVDKVTYTGLHIVYKDGSDFDYPAESMASLREHSPSIERLLHNAASVSFNDLSVVDSEGNKHELNVQWTFN